MKFSSMVSYTSALAALASMPLLTQSIQAGPNPILAQVPAYLGDQPRPERTDYHSNWSDDQRRELRHIFYRLEHANRDYEGHKANALHEIQEAAEAMGMDLHGSGYAQQWEGTRGYGGYDQQTENQAWSDDTLRRCEDRLKDLANDTQDPVRHDLFEAAHELDRALDSRER